MKVAVLSFAHERAIDYIRLLRARPGVELVAADPDASPGDPQRGPAMAHRLGVEFASGWNELFAGRPDAVVLTSETSRRRELVERAATVGAQILCEPPIAPDEDDAVPMIDACARAGVGLTLACPLRWSPAFNAVRRALADGELGTLMTVSGVHNSPPAYRDGGPRSGALAVNAPCLIDLVDALLDGERAEQVYAQANGVLTDRSDIDSAALVTVRYANGTVAALDCSWSRPAAEPVRGGPTMTFIGDRATLEFDANPQLLGGFDSVAAQGRWTSAAPDPDSLMLDSFLGAVGNRERTGPDGAVGLRALRIVSAAYRSLRAGQPVAVER